MDNVCLDHLVTFFMKPLWAKGMLLTSGHKAGDPPEIRFCLKRWSIPPEVTDFSLTVTGHHYARIYLSAMKSSLSILDVIIPGKL